MSENSKSNGVLHTIRLDSTVIVRPLIWIIIGLITCCILIGFIIFIYGIIRFIICIFNSCSKKVEIYDDYIKISYVFNDSEIIPRSEILKSRFEQDWFDKHNNTGNLFIITNKGYIEFGRVSNPQNEVSFIKNYAQNSKPIFTDTDRQELTVSKKQETATSQKLPKSATLKSEKENYSTYKGKIGEQKIVDILESNEVSGYRKILRNLYVPYDNQIDDTEVDIVMIHETGIYVFESKNLSGRIYGTESNSKWSQYVSEDEMYPLHNPIMQNKTHISNLKSYLKLNYTPFISYVVFGRDSDIRKVPLDCDDCKIFCREDLANILNEHIRESKNTLAPFEVDEIYSKLLPLTQVSESKKQKHIDRLNKKYKN